MVAKRMRWFILATSSMTLMGVALFIAKLLVTHTHPLCILPFQYTAMFICSSFLIGYKGIRLSIEKKLLFFIFLLSFFIATGLALYYLALAKALTSTVVSTQNIGAILVATMLARIILREKPTFRGILGMTFTIISIAFLAIE